MQISCNIEKKSLQDFWLIFLYCNLFLFLHFLNDTHNTALLVDYVQEFLPHFWTICTKICNFVVNHIFNITSLFGVVTTCILFILIGPESSSKECIVAQLCMVRVNCVFLPNLVLCSFSLFALLKLPCLFQLVYIYRV